MAAVLGPQAQSSTGAGSGCTSGFELSSQDQTSFWNSSLWALCRWGKWLCAVPTGELWFGAGVWASGVYTALFWAPPPAACGDPAEQQMLQVRCSASHLGSLLLSSETQCR